MTDSSHSDFSHTEEGTFLYEWLDLRLRPKAILRQHGRLPRDNRELEVILTVRPAASARADMVRAKWPVTSIQFHGDVFM